MTRDIEAHRTVDAVWRIESARIIAGLARLVQDVGLAEELAQDALVAALEQWPAEGIPAKPGAWLMLTARHRAIDRVRREERLAGKLALLGRELEVEQGGAPAEFEAVLDEERIDDDLLRLMFISCHPVLSTEARVVLTLRLLGGLTTEEIARGLLTAESTIAKRITRASARWPAVGSRSKCHRWRAVQPGWRRCLRSFTSSSMRGTPPWPEMTGCAPRCAPRRYGSAGY